MKIYSRIITIAIINILFLISCHKKDTPVPVSLTLMADKTSFTESSSAGKDSVQITSNTSWSITNIPSWITITPSSGTGNTKVYINYTGNIATSSRSTTLTLKATGANDISLQITQNPNAVISSFTSHAAGGASITISGSGFSSTASENIVTINGISATVTNASPTSLTVTVPVMAGSGQILLSVNGQAAITAGAFIYDLVQMVTTLAGNGSAGSADGTGTNATFNSPNSLKVDANGNIYVADLGNNKIRKITPAGVVITFAGSGSAGLVDGAGLSAQFYAPAEVGIDANANVYVADNGNNEIRKITSAGLVTTFAGNGVAGNVDGTGALARFFVPWGIAIDANGNLFIADAGNNKIRKITPAGIVTTFAGSGVAGSLDGTGTSAEFYSPQGLAIDANGNLFVADLNNSKIRKITPGGVVTTFAGSGVHGKVDGTGTAAQFSGIRGIAIDTNGNLYVADYNNSVIRKITPGAVVTTFAGTGNDGSADGLPTAAEFNRPVGVAVDVNGNVYVADAGNHKIRKISFQ